MLAIIVFGLNVLGHSNIDLPQVKGATTTRGYEETTRWLPKVKVRWCAKVDENGLVAWDKHGTVNRLASKKMAAAFGSDLSLAPGKKQRYLLIDAPAEAKLATDDIQREFPGSDLAIWSAEEPDGQSIRYAKLALPQRSRTFSIALMRESGRRTTTLRVATVPTPAQDVALAVKQAIGWKYYFSPDLLAGSRWRFCDSDGRAIEGVDAQGKPSSNPSCVIGESGSDSRGPYLFSLLEPKYAKTLHADRPEIRPLWTSEFPAEPKTRPAKSDYVPVVSGTAAGSASPTPEEGFPGSILRIRNGRGENSVGRFELTTITSVKESGLRSWHLDGTPAPEARSAVKRILLERQVGQDPRKTTYILQLRYIPKDPEAQIMPATGVAGANAQIIDDSARTFLIQLERGKFDANTVTLPLHEQRPLGLLRVVERASRLNYGSATIQVDTFTKMPPIGYDRDTDGKPHHRNYCVVTISGLPAGDRFNLQTSSAGIDPETYMTAREPAFSIRRLDRRENTSCNKVGNGRYVVSLNPLFTHLRIGYARLVRVCLEQVPFEASPMTR